MGKLDQIRTKSGAIWMGVIVGVFMAFTLGILFGAIAAAVLVGESEEGAASANNLVIYVVMALTGLLGLAMVYGNWKEAIKREHRTSGHPTRMDGCDLCALPGSTSSEPTGGTSSEPTGGRLRRLQELEQKKARLRAEIQERRDRKRR